MNVRFLLIEDDLSDAEKIMESVSEFEDIKEHDISWHFTVEHLSGPGGIEVVKGRNYCFYNDAVISRIEEKMGECDEDTKLGLLLDVVLTRDELESKDKNFYPEVKLARVIYDRFHDKLPIYVITSVPSFFTHSERIMGVDLSQQFIPKDVLLKFKMESMIGKLKKYFVQWEKEGCSV